MKNLYRALLCLCVCGVPSLAAAQQQASAPGMQVLFIMDSSGSMWGQQDGRPKLDAGRDVIKSSLVDLPRQAKLGLLSFGHRRKNDCSDIELIAPMGKNNADEIIQIVGDLKPKGITPLSDALLEASKILKPLEGGKMIFLISDGGEECGGDPCAVAKQLAKEGLLMRVNVVGFNIGEKARTELQCIAKEGAGRYFAVTDKVSLYHVMEDVRKEVETFPQDIALKVDPAPPVAPPVFDGVDLLAASRGGHVVKADDAGWGSVISESDGAYVWTLSGREVIFAFKDEKPVTFSRMAIGIPRAATQNVRAFELSVSDNAEGPFHKMGHYEAASSLKNSIYQEFVFSEVAARYVKFKPLSNYGYELQGLGNTQIFQLKLFGKMAD